MITGLVAFGLTLALTVLVADELLRRREIQKWTFVGDVALRDLSGSAFKVCAGIVQAVGFPGYAEDLVAAQSHYAATGERPGHEAPALLPPDFEETFQELLEDGDSRSILADVFHTLSDELDDAIGRWASVMLRSPDLTDAFNAFGMMREALSWFIGSLGCDDETAQDRLNLWSNLRIYFASFATFDGLRREAFGEPLFYGDCLTDHDRAWGLPFETQRIALEAMAKR